MWLFAKFRFGPKFRNQNFEKQKGKRKVSDIGICFGIGIGIGINLGFDPLTMEMYFCVIN